MHLSGYPSNDDDGESKTYTNVVFPTITIRETKGEHTAQIPPAPSNRTSSPLNPSTSKQTFHHYSSPQASSNGAGDTPDTVFVLPNSSRPVTRRQPSLVRLTSSNPPLYPSLSLTISNSDDYKPDELSQNALSGLALDTDARIPDTPNSTDSSDDDDESAPFVNGEEKSESPSNQAIDQEEESAGDNIFYLCLMGLFALIASGSNAIFAMCKTPDKLHEWWEGLSDAERAEAIWIFAASISVNFILGYESIPAAIETLRLSFSQENKTFNEKAEIGATVVLGASAALASAAISYSAFTWAPPFVTYAVAVTSLFINFTTRYVGCKNLFNRVYTHYDKATIEKNRFLDDLSYINPRYSGYVEEAARLSIKESGKVDDKAVNLFTQRLLTKQNLCSDFSLRKRTIDRVGEYAMRSFETTFSLLIGVTALPTFDQKGVDGISKIVELKLDGGISHAPAAARAVAGFLPGAATAMLYAASAIDLPRLTVAVTKELYSTRNLKLISIFAFLTIANYYASASLESIEEGILKRDDRVFTFLTLTNFLGILSIYMNRTGAFATNTKASYAKFFSKPATEKAGLLDLKKYLISKSKTTRLDEETQHYVNRFSQFAHLDSPPMSGQNGHNVVAGGLSPAILPVALQRRHRAETEMSHLAPPDSLQLRTRNSF